MKALSSSESGSQFDALKKDFLFHEKRMQLLLSSSIVEGFDAAIQEKLTTRNECASDCKKTLEKLSHASQMPTLSGRWNESVVASVLQLNIPLRDVIGSQLFEATPTNECEDLKDCIRQLAEQSQDHAEFQSSGGGGDKSASIINSAVSNAVALPSDETNDSSSSSSSAAAAAKVGGIGPESELVQTLLKSVDPTALSARDVKRMRDAVQSKLRVITELSHLSAALQKSGFQLAQARADVCRLQEEEAMANDDGEVAVSETLVEQRIAALEKIIDIVFFRLHTVDATVDTNVTKRHSNLQSLQHSAVALEGVKREKQDAVTNCTEDIRRIDRSLQLQQVKEKNDSKGAEMLAESERKLRDIESKRVMVQDRLHQLGQEFIETERALSKLGVERAVAIDRHLDLVEQSRHLAADFAEMARFATAHRKNLEVTKERCSEGLGSVERLERLLLQETDFMQYNFRASAQRLQSVRENVASELRAALREYEISIGEMLRRKQEIVLGLDDQIHMAECEAELRKDVFDPTAKKYVDKQRDLELRRKGLIDEMCVLSEKLGQQISTIKSRLGEEFIGGGGGADAEKQQENNNASSTSSGTASKGGRFGAVSASMREDTARGREGKRLVSELKGKVLDQMAALENSGQQVDSRATRGASATAATATSSSSVSANTASKHIRDIVDGVARIAEDDELLRRNLRKHERLLDNRQALLEDRNSELSTIEEKKELAVLQQHVESSYVGPGPHTHVTQRTEHLSARGKGQRYRDAAQKQEGGGRSRGAGGTTPGYSSRQQQQQQRGDEDETDAVQNNDALDNNNISSINNDASLFSASGGSSYGIHSVAGTGGAAAASSTSGGGASSRARAVREEIRRARTNASVLFSPTRGAGGAGGAYAEEDGGGGDRGVEPRHSFTSTYRVGTSTMNNERGLAQVIAGLGRDDDDDVAAANAEAARSAVAGTGARAAARRQHPRVIGRMTPQPSDQD